MTNKPSTLQRYDKRGVPIEPGDLLRSDHYRDRRRMNYLYHVAVKEGDFLRAVPTKNLEPSKRNQGGDCLITEQLAKCFEIIHGHGPGEDMDFRDRKRKAVALAAVAAMGE